MAPLRRRARKVGAPLGLLIALGVVGVGIVLVLTLSSPLLGVIALVASSLAIGVVLLCYLWLDRWEPEPPRLLIFAFLWGGVVSVVAAIALQVGISLVVPDELFLVAVAAPVTEELLKGAFLLIMLTGRRRREMTSLTDHLVFAGFTAAGFAWVEDLGYLVGSGGDIATVAVMRLVFSPFAHPLFTTVTALGLWAGMRRRPGGARIGLIIAGFAGAMALHAIWNLSASVLGLGVLAVYALFMVPVFGLMVFVAVRARRREQELTARLLPGLVRDGIITPAQAGWLTSIAARRQAVTAAKATGDPALPRAVVRLSDAATELAHVRDRIDRGLGESSAQALHADLADTARHLRWEHPRLDALTVAVPCPPPPPPMGQPPMSLPPMSPPPMGQRPPWQQPPTQPPGHQPPWPPPPRG